VVSVSSTELIASLLFPGGRSEYAYGVKAADF
jgi:hypothetical protein